MSGWVRVTGTAGAVMVVACATPAVPSAVHQDGPGTGATYTNPVLDESSAEHATVRAAGWDIGFDGMEVDL